MKLKFLILIILINIALQQDICKPTNECNNKKREDCAATVLTGTYAEKCQCCWHELLGNSFCGPETLEFAKEINKKKKFDIGTIYCKKPSSSSLNKAQYIFIIIFIILYL